MPEQANHLTNRQKVYLLESELEQNRESFIPLWRDLSDFVLPRRSRFFITDNNKGDRRNLKIIDSTATLASRTFASGMMTGVTSPARSWFKLGLTNFGQDTSDSTKGYLEEVTDVIRQTFLLSNLYNVLPTIYEDLGTFGTACMFMESDPDEGVRFTSFPIGSYAVANDRKGRARVFWREFQMSVRQIVDKFGRGGKHYGPVDWTNISQTVRDQWERGQSEEMINVSHMIKPNPKFRPGSPVPKFKRYVELYYERGTDGETQKSHVSADLEEKFLSEKGYSYFPILCVRWQVTGEDTYGTMCPGMIALGDIKALQLGEKRIAQALDQKVNPSMVGPTALKNAKASILPGDITYIDERDGTPSFRKLFDVNFDIRELEAKQEQVRQRISRSFYEDLFLMLANSTRREITAREIEERHEEKLLALGPVLESINQDLLDPMIDNTFNILTDLDRLPEVPQELQGQDYKVEYISVMAQAQKIAGIGNLERFMGFAGQVAQFDPVVLKKVDTPEMLEEYADKVGISVSLLRSNEEVEKMVEEEQQLIRQQQELEQLNQAADVGQKLGNTEITESNALGQVLGVPEGV